MKLHEWFSDKIDQLKGDFEFRFETIIYRLTEKIAQKMEEKKITRTELAKRMNVSSPYVTKILRGNANFTLRSMLSLADALDQELKIDFEEKKPAMQSVHVHSGSYIRKITSAASTVVYMGDREPAVSSTANQDFDWELKTATGGGVS